MNTKSSYCKHKNSFNTINETPKPSEYPIFVDNVQIDAHITKKVASCSYASLINNKQRKILAEHRKKLRQCEQRYTQVTTYKANYETNENTRFMNQKGQYVINKTIDTDYIEKEPKDCEITPSFTYKPNISKSFKASLNQGYHDQRTVKYYHEKLTKHKKQ